METSLPIAVSARTGEGLDALRARDRARRSLGARALRDTAAISNVSHVALLQHARDASGSAAEASGELATPEEFVLSDLQAARTCLDEVVGTRDE